MTFQQFATIKQPRISAPLVWVWGLDGHWRPFISNYFRACFC